MFNRRRLLLSLAALPIPLSAAVAEPWWDQRREDAYWARERERERRNYEMRHWRWDERRAHEAWERRRRIEARREWERHHHRDYHRD